MSYPVGRAARTITYAGVLTGDYHVKDTPAIFPAVGIFSHNPNYDVRCFVYSRALYIVRMFTYFPTTGLHGPGIELRVRIEIDDGDGSPVAVENYIDYAYTPILPFGKQNSFGMNGTFSVTMTDVSDRFNVNPFDSTRADANGFPFEPHVDVNGFIDYYGSAAQDGIPARTQETVLVAAAGSVITATMTVGDSVRGSVTTTATKTIGSSLIIEEGIWPKHLFGYLNEGGSSAISWTVDSHTFGPSISTSYTSGSTGTSGASVSPGGTSVSASASSNQGGGSLCDMACWPDVDYSIVGRLRALSDPFPDAVNMNLVEKQQINPGSGSWEPHVIKVLANPNMSHTINQKYNDGAVYTFDGASSQTSVNASQVLERCPIRMWLNTDDLTALGDQVPDWRVQVLGVNWDAATYAHAAQVILDNGGSTTGWTGTNATVTSTAGAIVGTGTGSGASITRTFSPTIKPETHRTLRLRLKASSTMAITITMALKTWTVNVTTSYANYDLDMTCAGNETVTLKTKDTRFDIQNPGGFPTNTDPKVQYEMGWGVNFIDTIKLSGFGNTDVVYVDQISLETINNHKISTLAAFAKEEQMWQSPTDDTKGFMFWESNTDGRVNLWPHMAHVYPFASSDTFTWYTIGQFLTLIAYDAGVTATPLADPPDGYYGQALEANHFCGGGATYNYGPLTWTEWVDKVFASGNLPAQGLFDELVVFGGCGKVWTQGAFWVPTDVAFTKFLRARSEGLAFNLNQTPNVGATVVTFKTAFTGISGGSGITDSLGTYITGLPYEKGGTNYTTQFHFGPLPYLFDAAVMTNRWHKRTSFRAPNATGEKQPFLLETMQGESYLATVNSTGDVMVRWSPFDGPYPAWQTTTTAASGVMATRPTLCWDVAPHHRVYLIFEVPNGSNLDLYWCYTDDQATSFSTPVLLQSTAARGMITAGPDGSLLMSWFVYDSGTSGPGTLYGQYKACGDVLWGTATLFLDQTGNPIKIADQGWSTIDFAYSSPAPFCMAPILDGDTTPSFFFCTDPATDLTWQKV